MWQEVNQCYIVTWHSTVMTLRQQWSRQTKPEHNARDRFFRNATRTSTHNKHDQRIFNLYINRLIINIKICYLKKNTFKLSIYYIKIKKKKLKFNCIHLQPLFWFGVMSGIINKNCTKKVVCCTFLQKYHPNYISQRPIRKGNDIKEAEEKL